MTLQMHMNPTVILPEPNADPNAESTGGIGWKTTMRVFSADSLRDDSQDAEEEPTR